MLFRSPHRIRANHPPWRWLRGCGSLVICLALLGIAASPVRGWIRAERGANPAQSQDEYRVKAAFLYNFTKFVEWPGDAFVDGGGAFVIGLVGSDPFGPTLDQTVASKSVNGRQLQVRRLKPGQTPRGCQILFIGASERRRLPQILDSLRGLSVLTVSEMEQFNQLGGMINFVMEDSKVGFEINAVAADRAHLKISSKLLQLAKSGKGR